MVKSLYLAMVLRSLFQVWAPQNIPNFKTLGKAYQWPCQIASVWNLDTAATDCENEKHTFCLVGYLIRYSYAKLPHFCRCILSVHFVSLLTDCFFQSDKYCLINYLIHIISSYLIVFFRISLELWSLFWMTPFGYFSRCEGC